MIKMSKTIQLSWAIDYSDPHFSGNGKSFNQDQARSKIFNSPLFLCRIWSSPLVLYPRAELQEREARQMWKSGPIPQSLLLTSLNVWLDLSRSLPRFGDKGKNSLQLTQFLILSNWETALLFACKWQKSDRLLEGMTGWWNRTVSIS